MCLAHTSLLINAEKVLNLLTHKAAASALKSGALIAYPTEGVYGLAADATNATAVQKVLALKARPESKGFIVMASTFEQLIPFIKPLDAKDKTRILESLRGGYRFTWIVPASAHCPTYLRGEFETLAIRITSHPDAKALCDAMEGPIVSTSANLHKGEPLASPKAILDVFGDKLAGVMEGEVGGLSSPTRIVELESGRVIRE